MKVFYVMIVVSVLGVFCPSAHAVGGGALHVPTQGLTPGEEIGFRQRVQLDRSGSLLVGSIDRPPFKAITIDAITTDSASLILRELEHPSVGKTYLFSAPEDLISRINRTTLFLYPQYGSANFYEYSGTRWHQTKSTQLPNGVKAYILGKPGLYLVTTDSNVDPESLGLNNRPRTLFGGNVVRGLTPVIAAFSALIFGLLVSHWAHMKQRRETS